MYSSSILKEYLYNRSNGHVCLNIYNESLGGYYGKENKTLDSDFF